MSARVVVGRQGSRTDPPSLPQPDVPLLGHLEQMGGHIVLAVLLGCSVTRERTRKSNGRTPDALRPRFRHAKFDRKPVGFTL